MRYSLEVEHALHVDLHRYIVGVGRHEVGHMGPPALHDFGVGQLIHRVVVGTGKDAEEVVALGVKPDRIVRHARILQRLRQLGEDLVVALAIFLGLAREEVHAKGNLLGHLNPHEWSLARFVASMVVSRTCSRCRRYAATAASGSLAITASATAICWPTLFSIF